MNKSERRIKDLQYLERELKRMGERGLTADGKLYPVENMLSTITKILKEDSKKLNKLMIVYFPTRMSWDEIEKCINGFEDKKKHLEQNGILMMVATTTQDDLRVECKTFDGELFEDVEKLRDEVMSELKKFMKDGTKQS